MAPKGILIRVYELHLPCGGGSLQFFQPGTPRIETEYVTAECNGAGRDNQHLVTGRAQECDVFRKAIQPVAINSVGVIDQQGRANLHNQAAKIIQSQC